MDGQIDRQTNRQTNGQMEGFRDVQRQNYIPPTLAGDRNGMNFDLKLKQSENGYVQTA
ncbi:hypothetical protein DPMN_169619 [Dreissena polymorpha]|uniref:Uncharacterized protein n=1 Tax=Dreissena polymorpha TaxID=45954 RepID=A0A9D4DY90_DREPO|nr:hypothetical protein DPMN_169619 [Dreissena polymorpha]